MPTLTTTVGAADTNSYVTVSYATSYFDERLNTSDWDNADQADQERALIMAARRLDQEPWEGAKTDPDPSDQALAWPRNNATDRDGHLFENDVIPEKVKEAQCELALAMLGEDLLDDTGLEGFEEVEVGPVSVTPRHSRQAGELPENVRREIAALTLGGGRNHVYMQRG